jgi:selenocysteine lyase/cysteine desulfurase
VCNVQVDGVDTQKLQDHLWNKHRIFTVTIKHDEFEGLRVSPAVYTMMEELDRFCDAVEAVIKDGLPG